VGLLNSFTFKRKRDEEPIMSEQKETFDPFDPTGMFKGIRDANMDSLSKVMTQYVNSEPYAKASAAMLDSWLASSAPFRKAIETTMTQMLANLHMPGKADILRMAERLTNIEMRLDDLEAKVDEMQHQEKRLGDKETGRQGENSVSQSPSLLVSSSASSTGEAKQ
jgi:hypothetical protein